MSASLIGRLGVKHFQAIHHCGVDVAHGLVLLYGIGTSALPSCPLMPSKNRSTLDAFAKYNRQRRETNGLSVHPPRNFELRCHCVGDRSRMCERRGM